MQRKPKISASRKLMLKVREIIGRLIWFISVIHEFSPQEGSRYRQLKESQHLNVSPVIWEKMMWWGVLKESERIWKTLFYVGLTESDGGKGQGGIGAGDFRQRGGETQVPGWESASFKYEWPEPWPASGMFPTDSPKSLIFLSILCSDNLDHSQIMSIKQIRTRNQVKKGLHMISY